MSVTLAPDSGAEITRKQKTILLAAPRGFCAGVDRAIQIVERSIEKFGAPIYVRHEIVHNRHVVERLSKLGAIFVEELSDCPDDRPVVFSAHGVPKAVPKWSRKSMSKPSVMPKKGYIFYLSVMLVTPKSLARWANSRKDK